MAWTLPKTWTSGEILTAANMNTHVRDNLKAVFGGATGAAYPLFSGNKTDTQAYTADTWANIALNVINGDIGAGWNAVAKRYEAPIAGAYIVCVSVTRDASGSNVQRCKLLTSYGAEIYIIEFVPNAVSSENGIFSGAHVILLPAGSWVSAQFSVSATGTITVGTSMTITYLHP